MNYPTALDNGTSLPNPIGTNTQNNPDHASLHTSENAAIIAAETKLGIGSSTPASNTLLIGTGAGTSAWSALTSAQLAAVLSDETGSGAAVFANTPTLITPKVDTINENTLNNGVTVGGVSLKSSVISTNNAVPTAAIADSAVTSAKLATGVCVQQVSFLSTTVATGTTTIPADDTIPQNTEGDQYMTLAITPKSATNILEIVAVVQLASSAGAGNLVGALFQDATANALATDIATAGTAHAPQTRTVVHTMISGTTSATTFKLRAGNAASAGTTTLNGSNGARLFGATTHSTIIIREYKA